MKKLLFVAGTAVVLAWASGKVMASDLILNVSGTVKYQYLEDYGKGTVASFSFSEKNVYTIVSNAVAEASELSDGAIVPVNLPANGYIAFSTNSDTEINGTFYVTNKSGFYYPLSGVDTNNNYYSWMELDAETFNGYTLSTEEEISMDLGWYSSDEANLFNNIASYNYSSKGSGSGTSTSTAVFYVHDDPYSYNDSTAYMFNADDTVEGNKNQNAIEIRGVLTAGKTLSNNAIENGTMSLSGIGNFILSGEYSGVVGSGSAKFSP